MPDYQKLYTNLFNRVSDVIAQLQYVQRECGDIYIETATADDTEKDGR